MADNNDWHPNSDVIPSDETIEHERLIQEIRLAQNRQKSLDEQGDDNSVFAGLEAIELELELDGFYKEHPEFDPSNMRWSQEFCEIGSDPYIKPRFDWLQKSTWTTIEAINLVSGYRPGRPQSLLEGSQRMILDLLDTDLFVKINPVNPNVEPAKFRFKPSDFVTWLSAALPGSVPDPIRSLSTLPEDREDNPSTNKHVQWRSTQRDEHRAAIRFVVKRWPEQCVGSRGKKTGDSIATALDDHWAEVKRSITFTYKQLSHRTVANLAREILKNEITD
jgi:hypothetical protein